jgi:hypothetical protein
MATRSRASKKVAKPRVADTGGRGVDELIARHRRALPVLQAAARSGAERLQRERVLQPGSIVLHSGSGAGGILLKSSEAGVELRPLEPGDETASALVEVTCDPARLTSIIEGKKDARTQFLAGGIRVRGDMAYLSQIGMQLGFLDRPLV